MSHPLEALSQARLARLFWLLLVAALVIFSIFRVLETRLTSVPGGAGVVAFELARTGERAQEIVAAWPEQERLVAAFGLGLDYLFMPVYGTLLAAACLWAGRALAQRRLWGAALAVPLAWAMWLAMLFDAVENYALLTILLDGAQSQLPSEAGLAYWSAIFKFALIAVGIVYALYGRIAAWLKRPVPAKAKKAPRA